VTFSGKWHGSRSAVLHGHRLRVGTDGLVR
jgi:methyl coenzyme M reductase gamma subunit